MYSRIAISPGEEFHFHRGPEYAVTKLGYDSTELAALHLAVTSSFAGVGNPHAIRQIEDAAIVRCVVISNGVLNLVPNKHKALAEIARVRN